MKGGGNTGHFSILTGDLYSLKNAMVGQGLRNGCQDLGGNFRREG